MQKLYRISWTTKDIETAVLLDGNNMNDGASVETWLCKDSNGRKFTCSKFDWQFSELAAWQEYEAEMEETVSAEFAEMLKAQKSYQQACDDHLAAKQKVLELANA
jgi:thioesterase domain-containing protein